MKECGGVSPFDAMMTQMSMTTSSLQGDMSAARRYVTNVLELVVLFTLAMCPLGVNSTIWKGLTCCHSRLKSCKVGTEKERS